MEIKQYVKTRDEFLNEALKPKKLCNTKDLLYNLFDNNMKEIIKWDDGDFYSGEFKILYQDINTNKYYYFEGKYGSCPGCDDWEEYIDDDYDNFYKPYNSETDLVIFNEFINNILNRFVVYNNLSEFIINEYWHPEWKKIVNIFFGNKN